MTEYTIGARKFLPSILIALCFTTSLLAQEPADSPDATASQTQQNPDAAKNTDQGQEPSPVTPAEVPTPGYPIDAQIHPAGRAIPWYGTSSPLKWGGFSIREFTYDHIYDRFFPSVALPPENISLDIFRTSLVFEKSFRGQKLVLQYVPQLALLNGNVASNAGVNNEVMLGTTFQISPRLDIGLKDEFAQVRSRELFPPEVLAVDQQAGNLIANAYLQNAGSYLSNTVGAVANYRFSPRLLLTVSPYYSYTDVTGLNGVNYVANGHTIATKASLVYGLTARQNLGVVYGFEALRAAGVANAGDTNFTTAGLYYGYQVAKTWWFRGEIGANRTTYGNAFLPLVTIGGSVSLVKAFSNSTFGLAYTRGRTDTNFITPNIGDRTDAAYTLHLTKRLTWNAGAGIYRETGLNPQNKGSYATSAIEFGLSPSMILDTSYAYTFQRSSTLQLLSGIRNTLVVGIKWEPQLLKMH